MQPLGAPADAKPGLVEMLDGCTDDPLAGGFGQTAIIGISGRTDADDESAARSAGMNVYLRKPLSPSALGEALAVVVQAAPARDPEK